MSQMKIKKGDFVQVIVGDENEKGKTGKVVAVFPSENKVIVENVNIVKRHTKPRSAQQSGGIIEKPRAIDASNVMLYCPNCKKGVRFHVVKDEAGNKVRQCAKCDKVIDKAPAKEAEQKTATKAKRKSKKAEEAK